MIHHACINEMPGGHHVVVPVKIGWFWFEVNMTGLIQFRRRFLCLPHKRRNRGGNGGSGPHRCKSKEQEYVLAPTGSHNISSGFINQMIIF